MIDYKFKNKETLKQALTHGSVSSDLRKNYERLEFLGDRVLSVSIADLLYENFSCEPEGSLSQRHTALVCKETVAEVARGIKLGKEMKIANEELRDNENVLCDVCEAVIGAIFIDGGFNEAFKFVKKHWEGLLLKDLTPPKDAKTALQEIAHIKGLGAPVYKIISRSGSEHEPIFSVSVSLKIVGDEIGEGKNKKLAEQSAATKMLGKLNGC